MELKDGKIVVSEEERNILNSKEGRDWLKENKIIVEVEKKVEIEKPLTDEIVKDYISKSQGLSDKLYNDNSIKFLKTKLGKDVTIDDLGKEITFKDELSKLKSEAIKTAVNVVLGAISPKHSKLLINAIDFSKLDIKDNNLTGFDDELNNLKTTYPDLFINKISSSNTPPTLPNNNGGKNITKDDFKKMGYAERTELYNTNKKLYEELSK
ncbi:MAG: hypothetical protein SOY60_06920 [Fusobacterium gastrosuis]|uniref:phage scaffolding protein n=1 Tax=Fusobacterium gastrosuis TaxID=1755100 RepID=UPI002A8DD82F|nr:hypothetical protein [Fusobacterium gastrosuis]